MLSLFVDHRVHHFSLHHLGSLRRVRALVQVQHHLIAAHLFLFHFIFVFIHGLRRLIISIHIPRALRPLHVPTLSVPNPLFIGQLIPNQPVIVNRLPPPFVHSQGQLEQNAIPHSFALLLIVEIDLIERFQTLQHSRFERDRSV